MGGYIAADAVEAVEIEYEELPVVLDPYAALQPGAPVIREDLAGKTEELEEPEDDGELEEDGIHGRGGTGERLGPQMKLSNRVTLSALVQTPVRPAAVNPHSSVASS